CCADHGADEGNRSEDEVGVGVASGPGGEPEINAPNRRVAKRVLIEDTQFGKPDTTVGGALRRSSARKAVSTT
ncbi:hypothetical protein ABT116_42420, partial [Streptomyces sp. NPDC002130]|uniref:hypothetical protein n=1 Tax=Streptomyces sp. NPDC002130 TaxID=3155568 RepID=UPI00332F754B